MFKNLKKKAYKILVPISMIISSASMVFAEDEITRKLNRGKVFILGALTTAAAINVAYAIFRAGAAKGQGEIESAEKYRKNAWIAFFGITLVDVFIGLWNSW